MPLYSLVAPGAAILPMGSVIANAAATVWPAVNRAIFSRFAVGTATPMRYVNWTCGVASGNVQVGIVRLTSSSATPSYERVAHTGVIACPVAGDIHSDLGAAALLGPGDYAAFLWADNITFQARNAAASGMSSLRVCGTESSLASGVGATGTVTWGTTYVILSVEA